MAGVIVALMPLAFRETIHVPVAVMIVVFVAVAYLMVSTIRYSKPQVTFLKKFDPARLGIVIAFIIIGLIAVGFFRGFAYSAALLFLIILIYVVSGIVAFLLSLLPGKNA